MKVLFVTNNSNVYDLIEWINNSTKDDVLLYKDKLTEDIFRKISPEIVVSFGYRYIIKKNILDLLPQRFINLHISLLPWNRGADPNIWSFLEDTPKGVSIHIIDEGVDTGPILLKKEIHFDLKNETLASSYNILQCEIINLFKENWTDIKKGNIKPIPQKGMGTVHYKKDKEKINFLLGEKGWDIPIIELKNNYKNFILKKNEYSR